MFDGHLVRNRLAMRCHFLSTIIGREGIMSRHSLYDLTFKEGKILFDEKKPTFNHDEVFLDCLTQLKHDNQIILYHKNSELMIELNIS
jgi:hypothetical protein